MSDLWDIYNCYVMILIYILTLTEVPAMIIRCLEFGKLMESRSKTKIFNFKKP